MSGTRQSTRNEPRTLPALMARQEKARARREDLRQLILTIPLMPAWSNVFPLDHQWGWLPGARRLAACLSRKHDGSPPYPCGQRAVNRDLRAIWSGDPTWQERANIIRPNTGLGPACENGIKNTEDEYDRLVAIALSERNGKGVFTVNAFAISSSAA